MIVNLGGSLEAPSCFADGLDGLPNLITTEGHMIWYLSISVGFIRMAYKAPEDITPILSDEGRARGYMLIGKRLVKEST